MNLCVSCAGYWFGPNLADRGHICSCVYSQLGERREKQRAGWSRMASAGQPGRLGTLSDGLLSTTRLVWTGSTVAAGFWERQWKCARLGTTTCHFCHFLSARTSHETRPNSRGRERRLSPGIPLDKGELLSHSAEGYGWKEERRIRTTFAMHTGQNETGSP